jgi:23S rRNA (uracil1939-C5)-methyltransferase
MPPSSLVELTVGSLGARGDGIAVAADGRRVFLPLTVPGDRVRAKLGAEAGPEGVRGDVVAVLEPGPDRAEPVCPHFGVCGGCALQHVADAAYAAAKLDSIRVPLARVGLGDVPFAPLARTAPGERRRARFAALKKGGRTRFGFNERQSHRLADLTACPVLRPELAALITPLRAELNAILPDGGRADVMASVMEGGIDLMLVGPPRLDGAARDRLARFAETMGLARLSWRPDDRRGAEPIAHRLPLAARFDGIAVTPPPGAFLQASAAGEAALTQAVVEAVAGAGRIADLFAGLGTFALPLARTAAVAAVEGDGAAVDALNRSGHGRRLTATRRDLFETPLTAKELARFDAVVFDPPRAGAAAQAAVLAASRVPLVVGVSCNPATFARDARALADGGYELVAVHPVDQFLWSSHVELAGVFRRPSITNR